MKADFDIVWLDKHREPQCPADPRYPTGIDLDVSAGAKIACQTPLPYPAKRCGMYVVTCKTCGWKSVVTTAGRADDPRSLTVPCNKAEN